MANRVVCVEVRAKAGNGPTPEERDVLAELRGAGLSNAARVEIRRRYFLEGAITAQQVAERAAALLVDPVTEAADVLSETPATTPAGGRFEFEIHPRPGVTDPTAASVLHELSALGLAMRRVWTARRFVVEGAQDSELARRVIQKRLANDCIEQTVIGSAGVGAAAEAQPKSMERRTVALKGLDDAALTALSRRASLFLSLPEMREIQKHFATLGRDPSDLELETLAQTWSEHCVHKTLKSAVAYEGAPFGAGGGPAIRVRYGNLLRDTIARATRELIAEGRGPECLSVFVDNAGVIGFDERFGVAFKVETHNRPSAIEPYGGAATGIGGCIRDVLGCGLGADPIASTNVFCVAPGDWPEEALPRGVLHPRRILRSVVQGVADYGNRMGIPTVNGAVYFDPRYLGNPLVYCGCIGLIPRDRIAKHAKPGDLIVVIGGRTGRDGIHGATFSSGELTDTHADEFAHAVQIGHAIEEKRVLDAVIRARDAAQGCLFSAITDCGAGGLSSAVGEMAGEIGARVELETVPLKYAGLRYDEIWISEAQERMVLAVAPANLAAFQAIMRAEQVESTVIGRFGDAARDFATAGTRLIVRYRGQTMGDLDLHFLHEGLPKIEREAKWSANTPEKNNSSGTQLQTNGVDWRESLRAALRNPTTAAKSWIVRRYDHEVQGGSVVKPFAGRGRGPTDAAVLRPVLRSSRGLAVGCGLQPQLSEVDPYWMAANGIDEAIRNVVCVGGDPRRTAILDNFCWGGVQDAGAMGSLARACQACYDVAKAFGTPFVSGKDSLNNQFALEAGDVDRVVREIARRSGASSSQIEAAIRASGRIVIPETLLISAMAIVDDVATVCTADLKHEAGDVWLVGGFEPIGFDLSAAARVHQFVSGLIWRREIRAAHDVSEGGWLTALAEMAIGGQCGVHVDAANLPDATALLAAGYLVQLADGVSEHVLQTAGVSAMRVAQAQPDSRSLRWGDESLPIEELSADWRSLER